LVDFANDAFAGDAPPGIGSLKPISLDILGPFLVDSSLHINQVINHVGRGRFTVFKEKACENATNCSRGFATQ
jgi:hypothetical protein